MSALRCRTGRKGRKTHHCTHTLVLGQPVVPAHEGSGRVNAREVLPWDAQHPVIFGTVTLRREQTQSEMSPCVGFDTKTLISPSSCLHPEGQDAQQSGYRQPELRGFIHPMPLGSRANLDLLGPSTTS